mgnify:FL=1
MNWIQQNKKYLTLFSLALLMALTRSSHFGSAISLPDASLAAFYLAGIFSGGLISLVVLLSEAALLDYISITQFNVSDYCISPAYVFLIPTYATMFIAGKWSAKYASFSLRDVTMQLTYILVASSVAFLISNGSFYFLSGKFADLSWLQYSERVAQYYSPYVSSTLIYSSVILCCTKLVAMLNKSEESLEVLN